MANYDQSNIPKYRKVEWSKTLLYEHLQKLFLSSRNSWTSVKSPHITHLIQKSPWVPSGKKSLTECTFYILSQELLILLWYQIHYLYETAVLLGFQNFLVSLSFFFLSFISFHFSFVSYYVYWSNSFPDEILGFFLHCPDTISLVDAKLLRSGRSRIIIRWFGIDSWWYFLILRAWFCWKNKFKIYIITHWIQLSVYTFKHWWPIKLFAGLELMGWAQRTCYKFGILFSSNIHYIEFTCAAKVRFCHWVRVFNEWLEPISEYVHLNSLW